MKLQGQITVTGEEINDLKINTSITGVTEEILLQPNLNREEILFNYLSHQIQTANPHFKRVDMLLKEMYLVDRDRLLVEIFTAVKGKSFEITFETVKGIKTALFSKKDIEELNKELPDNIHEIKIQVTLKNGFKFENSEASIQGYLTPLKVKTFLDTSGETNEAILFNTIISHCFHVERHGTYFNPTKNMVRNLGLADRNILRSFLVKLPMYNIAVTDPIEKLNISVDILDFFG